jgi:hypothetical protein
LAFGLGQARTSSGFFDQNACVHLKASHHFHASPPPTFVLLCFNLHLFVGEVNLGYPKFSTFVPRERRVLQPPNELLASLTKAAMVADSET